MGTIYFSNFVLSPPCSIGATNPGTRGNIVGLFNNQTEEPNMANVSLKGIDIQNTNRTLYIKDGKDFYTAKNIGLQFCKHAGNVQLKYIVGGCAHEWLYVKDESGVMREADCSTTYYIKAKVVCDRSGRSELIDFVPTEDGKMVYHGWVGNGNVEQKTYELPDGDYNAELKYNYWAILDLGLTAEEVGFADEDTAKFFNSYSLDHEPHESLADKVCPTKDKQEIALNAIRDLFKTLKANGLKLVYDEDSNSLGVINDVAVVGCERYDDGAVPHWDVVPTLADEHPIFVSESWSFIVNK